MPGTSCVQTASRSRRNEVFYKAKACNFTTKMATLPPWQYTIGSLKQERPARDCAHAACRGPA
eukprot:365832-Chlamydomonas_euryale.AAC.11